MFILRPIIALRAPVATAINATGRGLRYTRHQLSHMLILGRILSLPGLYFSTAFNITGQSWRYAQDQLTRANANIWNVGAGILVGSALLIVVPIIFIPLPAFLFLLSSTVIVPVCGIAICANIINLFYRLINPYIRHFFEIPEVSDAVSAPVRYLRSNNFIGQGWDRFLEKPQDWMMGFCHQLILCTAIAMPEYYCLRYLVISGFNLQDWVLHICLMDAAIGVALQFSPASQLQQKLNDNADNAALFGAIQGMLCGVSQAVISHLPEISNYFFSTVLNVHGIHTIDLGATATLVGVVINIAFAQNFQSMLEHAHSRVIG